MIGYTDIKLLNQRNNNDRNVAVLNEAKTEPKYQIYANSGKPNIIFQIQVLE